MSLIMSQIGVFSHVQDTAAEEWVIQGPVGRPVNVCVAVLMPDEKLHQVLPQDVIVDPDTGIVRVIFPSPQTGQARLS